MRVERELKCNTGEGLDIQLSWKKNLLSSRFLVVLVAQAQKFSRLSEHLSFAPVCGNNHKTNSCTTPVHKRIQKKTT